jgi:hypothetical protein
MFGSSLPPVVHKMARVLFTLVAFALRIASYRNCAYIKHVLSVFNCRMRKGIKWILAKHFHSVDPLKCSEEEDWLSLSNGTIYIDPGIKKKYGGISCSITFFDRIDDFGNKDLKELYFSDETKLPLLSDYFKANCKATDGSHYKNVHAGIRYVPEYHKKIRTVGSGLGLDILILGFDSPSHMTYRRKLAKTYKYFTENLKGIVLNG